MIQLFHEAPRSHRKKLKRDGDDHMLALVTLAPFPYSVLVTVVSWKKKCDLCVKAYLATHLCPQKASAPFPEN